MQSVSRYLSLLRSISPMTAPPPLLYRKATSQVRRGPLGGRRRGTHVSTRAAQHPSSRQAVSTLTGLFMKSGDTWLQRKPARGIAGQRIRAVTSSISRLRHKNFRPFFAIRRSCISRVSTLLNPYTHKSHVTPQEAGLQKTTDLHVQPSNRSRHDGFQKRQQALHPVNQ